MGHINNKTLAFNNTIALSFGPLTPLEVAAYQKLDLPQHVLDMRAGPIRYEVHLFLANGNPLVIDGKTIVLRSIRSAAPLLGCSPSHLDQTLSDTLNLKGKSYTYQEHTVYLQRVAKSRHT